MAMWWLRWPDAMATPSRLLRCPSKTSPLLLHVFLSYYHMLRGPLNLLLFSCPDRLAGGPQR
jgi:hypothetical protein